MADRFNFVVHSLDGVPTKNATDLKRLRLEKLPDKLYVAMQTSFLSLFRSLFQTQAVLRLENLALRHQLNVLRRSQRGRVQLSRADRPLWVWLSKIWSGWWSILVIVKPETVIAWHRKGFRLYLK